MLTPNNNHALKTLSKKYNKHIRSREFMLWTILYTIDKAHTIHGAIAYASPMPLKNPNSKSSSSWFQLASPKATTLREAVWPRSHATQTHMPTHTTSPSGMNMVHSIHDTGQGRRPFVACCEGHARSDSSSWGSYQCGSGEAWPRAFAFSHVGQNGLRPVFSPGGLR